MINYKDELKQWKELTAGFNKEVPDGAQAFGNLHQVVSQDGALSAKVKELMGVALGITARCEGCIVTHTNAAIQKGATMDEVVETVQIALLMGGGPAYMYGSKAIECAKQLLN